VIAHCKQAIARQEDLIVTAAIGHSLHGPRYVSSQVT
jgi:hypothetical protein